ncbi:MoaD/ThiS family protein [Pyrodictium abyssi]|uniref:MoaD/ThiS family protein n=1 Tax=Pyrodictium abyssi TaxID=54256 RepID=A0ABN6ZV78_9CREN|nr:MoaD/ThiS family protein [Pyrodictium abyssi]
MAIRVKVIGSPSEKLVEHREGMTVGDVLRELGLLSSEYVVARNGRVVAEDEPVEDGDEIVLYPVVSGG